jgi:hypothetical protein
MSADETGYTVLGLVGLLFGVQGTHGVKMYTSQCDSLKKVIARVYRVGMQMWCGGGVISVV